KDSTFILPLLVGLSTYIQTRVSQTPSMSAQQQQQQQMMTFMMPLMMVWITLALPSGVGVYWVVSNVFSLFASYYVYGRKAISWRQLLNPLPAPTPAARKPRPEQPEKNEEEEAEEDAEPSLTTPQSQRARRAYGRKRRGKRKDRR
ncbi:MAG: YidC/Oxa1 family membrane protein insertase, partial [Dehalococcoidia bacterium]